MPRRAKVVSSNMKRKPKADWGQQVQIWTEKEIVKVSVKA